MQASNGPLNLLNAKVVRDFQFLFCFYWYTTNKHRDQDSTLTHIYPTQTHRTLGQVKSKRAEQTSQPEARPTAASSATSSCRPQPQTNEIHNMTIEENTLEQRRAGYVCRGLV